MSKGTVSTSNRKGIEARLLEKARSQPAFRRRLIADPKATIAGELGVEFPSSLKLSVVEETDRELYLVLPASTPIADLDARDARAVVGGVKTAVELQAEAARKAKEAENSGKIFSSKG